MLEAHKILMGLNDKFALDFELSHDVIGGAAIDKHGVPLADETLASIRIKWPRLPVLVLSMYPETQYALVAIREGANGYVAKDAEPAELMGAIRQVAAGGQYVGHRIASQLHEQAVGLDTRPPHQRLTMREHQIMLMLLKGMSLTHIGEEMLISVKTVSTHRANLLEKLGVASTAELVLYAVRNGLIH